MGNERELNSIKKLVKGQCFGYFGFFSGKKNLIINYIFF